MGPGNSHDDDPFEEHPEDPRDDLGDESDEQRPGTRGPLPDPLDRVWLHPTELGGAFSASGAETTRRGGRRRSLGWVAPVVAGAAGALLTLGVLAATGSFDRSSSDTGTTHLAGDAVTTVRAPSAADALARLGPSVVAVFARDAKGSRRGSGVCVHHGTQLLTSGAVVGEAGSVEVVTSDGRTHAARVVGRDRVTDLVLLDIEDGANLPAAQLADTTLTTGAAVWLLGAPARGAKSPWMSSGMTSSNDAIAVSDRGPASGGLLETDAASNAGVIGGGLMNASGAVAGIVLGHVNGSTTTYAVPINVA